MSNPKPARVAIVPPKFGGTPSEDAYKFLQKFLRVSNSNNWDDDTKASQLPNYLTGTAVLWYMSWLKTRSLTAGSSSPNPVTWAELIKELQTAFKNVAHKEVAEDKLLARVQKTGE